MSSTLFVDGTSVIQAEWLNEINNSVFDAIGNGTTAPTTHGEVLENLNLNNVNNTSDLNKPISIATQSALDLKADSATVNSEINAINIELATKADAATVSSEISAINSELANKADTSTVNAALATKSDITTTVTKDSSTGAGRIPAGTSLQRPSSPANGDIRYNTDTSSYEGYKSGNWLPLGGGATGGGTNDVFYENSKNVTTNYTITSGKNAMSAGPITVDAGVVVTIPTGSVWTVI